MVPQTYRLPTGSAVLVVGHPGHELRLHRWLELRRPRVHVLEPGRTEEEPEGDAEASEELQPLELDESEIAAEDEEAPPSRPDPAR